MYYNHSFFTIHLDEILDETFSNNINSTTDLSITTKNKQKKCNERHRSYFLNTIIKLN